MCGIRANLPSKDLVAGGRGEREAYVRYRLVTDPYIAAYTTNSGYPAAELWGAHPPLRGTTAPLPLTDADADERDDDAGA